MTYSFLPEAELEYLRAIRFYEDQRPGLGARLIAEFEYAIEFAIERPQASRPIPGFDIRRVDLARFPYAIFFRQDATDTLQVTAFAHHRRRPGYWSTRIAP